MQNSASSSTSAPARTGIVHPLLVWVLVAVGLTMLFWWPLWTGGGLIGGDLYSYFYPQKQFLADHLQQGEFPLWNNRTGFGYPLIAESQTGALYPPHAVLYRLFDVNTAYNVNQILHYIAAFVFVVLYARRMGLSWLPAGLSALVYTYGWFPPRICLEWAIIGGVYLPLGLWCVESFLLTQRWRYLVTLSLAIGCQLLAGHYHLAFIHLGVLTVYIPARLGWAKESGSQDPFVTKKQTGLLLFAAMCCGFLLATVQLWPTWELKQQSQRAEVGQNFDPGQGHIPPLYLSQVVASWWMWYAPDIDTDQAINSLKWGVYPAPTNKVEAHLYFGLIPFFLILWALVKLCWSREPLPRRFLIWIGLGLVALIYTSGWLLLVAKHIPGFSFFQGPGRYGIITTLGVALLAGWQMNQWLDRRPNLSRRACVIVIMILTAGELWYVSRLVTYSTMMPASFLSFLPESPIAKVLEDSPTTTRVHAPGQNLPNLLRTSQAGVYLGLGPQEYYDPQLTFPKEEQSDIPFHVFNAEQIRWLKRSGVTHVLTYEPVIVEADAFTLAGAGMDPFLHRAWGLGDAGEGQPRPLHIYELKDAPGRVRWANSDTKGELNISKLTANEVVIEASCETSGQVVLTDLFYPGWEVEVDGEKAEALRADGQFRGVTVPAGKHRIHWQYRPRSVRLGAVVSFLTLLSLLALTFWHHRSRTRSETKPGSQP